MDCFASLAMTSRPVSPLSGTLLEDLKIERHGTEMIMRHGTVSRERIEL